MYRRKVRAHNGSSWRQWRPRRGILWGLKQGKGKTAKWALNFFSLKRPMKRLSKRFFEEALSLCCEMKRGRKEDTRIKINNKIAKHEHESRYAMHSQFTHKRTVALAACTSRPYPRCRLSMPPFSSAVIPPAPARARAMSYFLTQDMSFTRVMK